MSYFGGKQQYKKRYNDSKLKYEQEPECLVIPPSEGHASMLLVPCGYVDGCTLYVESHDPQLLEDSGLGPELHSGKQLHIAGTRDGEL